MTLKNNQRSQNSMVRLGHWNQREESREVSKRERKSQTNRVLQTTVEAINPNWFKALYYISSSIYLYLSIYIYINIYIYTHVYVLLHNIRLRPLLLGWLRTKFSFSDGSSLWQMWLANSLQLLYLLYVYYIICFETLLSPSLFPITLLLFKCIFSQ